MCVHPQAGFGELQRAADDLHHPLRRFVGGGGLNHLEGVTAVSHVGAAVGVGQRADERDGSALVAGAESGPSVTVGSHVGCGGAAVQHVDHVGLDVGQLIRAEHPSEDVEAAPRVRLGDLGMQRSRRRALAA